MFPAQLINNNLKDCNLFTLKTATDAWWFRYRYVLLLMLLALLPMTATAGFLEMPDTTEVPQFERESLLLDMDIPPVRERDPDPQAGPRLNVKEFRVQGIIEYPELDITREKIIEQVEAIRFEMMAEDKLLESGYTLDELGKVSDLIAEIEKETEGRHVGSLEVQRLVFLIREQRRQRGITLGMIETVANTITNYYRERGFILAKAYIPQQHVRDGIVNLTLLLGELGEIEVQNNKRYSSNTIRNIFKSVLAEPVTNDRIEEKLFLANDLPGLSAQGYFEPGTQVGDTKLNVNVTSERWYNANVRLDNHGSARSGEYRLYTDFLLHNPLGIGDQLHIGMLGSFAPENSLYGSLRYNTIVLNPRVKFSVGASNNDFVLGSGNSESGSSSSLDIKGKSVVVDASLKYQLKRSRVKNYAIGLAGSQIDSEIDLGEINSDFLDDSVRNIELFLEFDLLDEKSHILHQGNIGFTSSEFIKGANEEQDESPFIVDFDYSMLSFVKVPFTSVDSRVVLRASGQYAGTPLASVNQYSLAGPTRARGYAVNEYYADDAAYLGVDWIFKGPSFNNLTFGGERFENLMQPFVFLDYSYGKAYPFEQGGEGTEAQLVDAGFGIKLNYLTKLRGNLVFAIPINGKNTSLEAGEKPGDGMNLYFDLQYGF
jgi:hemolysin activation/secretion protein